MEKSDEKTFEKLLRDIKVYKDDLAYLRILFEWIHNPHCYNGSNCHELAAFIVEKIRDYFRRNEFSVEHQSCLLSIKERYPKKATEIVRIILQYNHAPEPHNFFWRYSPTLILHYYLKSELHEFRQAILLFLAQCYPFDNKHDNLLAEQLLAKFFDTEKPDYEGMATILNLFAPHAPESGRS